MKFIRTILFGGAFLLGILLSRYVLGADIKANGFLTAGMIVSDTDTLYNMTIDEKPNYFSVTRAGLNFNASFSKKWYAAIQLLNKYSEVEDDYVLSADWYFTTYRPIENLEIRAGKYKVPIWLVSDYYDVGFLYPWITPPHELYWINPVRRLTGASINYNYEFNNVNIAADAYFGKGHEKMMLLSLIDNPIAAAAYNGMNGTSYAEPFTFGETFDGEGHVYGGRLSFSAEGFLLRSAFMKVPTITGTSGGTSLDAEYNFWSLGSKLEYRDMFLYLEYGSAKIYDKTGVKKKMTFYDSFYGTLGYNFKIFVPHFTYSVMHVDMGESISSGIVLASAYKDKQETFTAACTAKLSDTSDVKLEYKKIFIDKYGYFSARSNMDKNINMLSLAVDVIF